VSKPSRRPAAAAAALLLAAVAAGCASDRGDVRPSPAPDRVTLAGPIRAVDGLRVPQKALGFADPDPVTVNPGPHTLGLTTGNQTLSVRMSFLPRQEYHLKFEGLLVSVLAIRNVTSGRTTYFDPQTFVFFDESRKPLPADKQPIVIP
jgi:hypothetical protein